MPASAVGGKDGRIVPVTTRNLGSSDGSKGDRLVVGKAAEGLVAAAMTVAAATAERQRRRKAAVEAENVAVAAT